MKHVALLSPLVVLATGSVALASAQSLELETVLSRAGEYVEQYYTRTQSLLVEETVILQPLSRSWSFEGFARRLEYELRVDGIRRNRGTGEGGPRTGPREWALVVDLVQHGVNGLVADVGDVDGLAGNLLELIAQPALRRALAEEGQRTIQALDPCDRQALL